MYNNYISQGVNLIPNVVSEGDNATIQYNGLLAKSGAYEIYAHVGFGDGENWNNSQYIKMTKTEDGFQTKIPIMQTSNLHVAFKDTADNWDNNSGKNYTFIVK